MELPLVSKIGEAIDDVHYFVVGLDGQQGWLEADNIRVLQWYYVIL